MRVFRERKGPIQKPNCGADATYLVSPIRCLGLVVQSDSGVRALTGAKANSLPPFSTAIPTYLHATLLLLGLECQVRVILTYLSPPTQLF